VEVGEVVAGGRNQNDYKDLKLIRINDFWYITENKGDNFFSTVWCFVDSKGVPSK
jgi:hypothetical protein